MFSQTWKKYLPVIAILMKRAINEDQVMSLNHTDFERAAGGKKVNFSFTNLYLINGRLDLSSKYSPFAKEFATILQENEQIKKIMHSQHFRFSINKDKQLMIKNITPPADSGVENSEESFKGESGSS